MHQLSILSLLKLLFVYFVPFLDKWINKNTFFVEDTASIFIFAWCNDFVACFNIYGIIDDRSYHKYLISVI